MDEPALWRALDSWYAGDGTQAAPVRATLAACPDRCAVLRRWLLTRALAAEVQAPGLGRVAVPVAAAWLRAQGLTAAH